jgi:hypothetical protein
MDINEAKLQISKYGKDYCDDSEDSLEFLHMIAADSENVIREFIKEHNLNIPGFDLTPFFTTQNMEEDDDYDPDTYAYGSREWAETFGQIISKAETDESFYKSLPADIIELVRHHYNCFNWEDQLYLGGSNAAANI